MPEKCLRMPEKCLRMPIYQITNNLNDSVYVVGTCLPLRKRWCNHKNRSTDRINHFVEAYDKTFCVRLQ